METKPLLYGLAGLVLGGLIVSTAAVTINKPTAEKKSNGMTMTEMADSLKNKNGDEYDMAFLASMIDHYEGAITMAKYSENHAKHDEVKRLSGDIVSAQEREITEMKQWQQDWGYGADGAHSGH